MFKHVLLYKTKDGVSRAAAEQAMDVLRGLPAVCPSIREWTIAPNVSDSPAAYDFIQLSSFDDEAGFQEFRRHPEHIKARDAVAQVVTWVVVDYMDR